MTTAVPGLGQFKKGAYGLRGESILCAIPGLAILFTFVLVQLPKVLGLQIDESGASRPENIVFWVCLGLTTVGLVAANSKHVSARFFLAPAPIFLLVFLFYASASVAWAYNAEYTLKAAVLQIIVIMCVTVPYALPIQLDRAMGYIKLSCAAAIVVNSIFVVAKPPSPIGHFGIYEHKQELGMIICMAIAVLCEELGRGLRRAIATMLLIGIGFWVINESHSRGSLAFLMSAPFVALAFLLVDRVFRISPAVALAAIPILCTALAIDTQQMVSRMAYNLYGDYTVTGRTEIWTFIQYQIAKFPWGGWGFHSYWFVPNSPHSAATGFVKQMASSHSGYLELRLENGAIGHAIFLCFVYTALRGLGRLARQEFIHAWLLLTIGVYVIELNLFESVWLSLLPNWLLFLVVFAELHHRLAFARNTGHVPVRRSIRQVPSVYQKLQQGRV